ncbi:DUF4298 domain-containing protein [Cutibacterium granulosum]|uniref:DUF4298 domain-containing protein n=3 Tax=Cutibacterium granulosum TaxID=33011 RepID=U1GFV9_9ACTN|nr:DUF4298 domain-containing protein [Cutibacterium granulosum]ERF57045.1 hypothetical protein H641_04196 [Cutibacterium granulosum DSM 20700]ERF65006.1 hypothetical protein H640_06330 [Cutibacterium granulosum TM11]
MPREDARTSQGTGAGQDDRITRVTTMEQRLNRTRDLVDRLDALLDEFERNEPARRELSSYYSSQEWFDDMAAQEAGQIPTDVPCGVLSEDAAFDLFGDHLRTAIRMLELGTAMVKER